MLLPIKFYFANIFLAGVTAGVVGGDMAIVALSDAKRREQLKDCADKVHYNCKTAFNMKPIIDSLPDHY